MPFRITALKLACSRTRALSGALAVAMLVPAAPEALAQTGPGAPSQADLDSLAAVLVRDGSPGAAVMLIRGGEVRLGTAGVRALGAEGPIRPGDRWHLGSNTKAMTAVLTARMVEAGTISWDDTVMDHLGDVVEDIRPEYAGITFPELFSHTSGLPANASGLVMFALMGLDRERDAPADRVEYARAVLKTVPAGERGRFHYSNAGYVVAGAMLEAATGESWEALVSRHVFVPLDIGSGGFGPPGRAEGEDPASQPSGHRADPEGELMAVPPGQVADNPAALGPAGRAHMNLEDYGRFLIAVMRGARGEDEGFLSPASWQRLLTPPIGGNYALGWGIAPPDASGSRSFRHAGSNTMWYVQAIVWPDADRAAVVAVNEARIERLRPGIASIFEALAP